MGAATRLRAPHRLDHVGASLQWLILHKTERVTRKASVIIARQEGDARPYESYPGKLLQARSDRIVNLAFPRPPVKDDTFVSPTYSLRPGTRASPGTFYFQRLSHNHGGKATCARNQ